MLAWVVNINCMFSNFVNAPGPNTQCDLDFLTWQSLQANDLLLQLCKAIHPSRPISGSARRRSKKAADKNGRGVADPLTHLSHERGQAVGSSSGESLTDASRQQQQFSGPATGPYCTHDGRVYAAGETMVMNNAGHSSGGGKPGSSKHSQCFQCRCSVSQPAFPVVYVYSIGRFSMPAKFIAVYEIYFFIPTRLVFWVDLKVCNKRARCSQIYLISLW